MNLINLPSAALPQSTGAAAPNALPLDLAMLDSAVPEELFAALLAGQLQAVTAVTGEGVDLAAQASDAPAEAVIAELAAMLQTPQVQPDMSALVAATAQQPVVAQELTELAGEGENGLTGLALPGVLDTLTEQTERAGNSADPRQTLAASTAAFAIPPAAVNAAASPASLNPAEQNQQTAIPAPVPAGNAPLPLAEAVPELLPQSQGGMTFALPQMQQTTVLNAPTQAQLTQAAQTSIPQPVGSQAWGGMVGERVVWMFGQQHQSAEIMLNPPSLGPLEVRLSMSDGQASLTFTTQHAPVREALEAATPRLREMLTESGIGLGNVSVNVGNFSRQDPQAQQQAAARSPSQWNESGGSQDFTVLTTELSGRKTNGLLDLFA